MKPCDKYWRSIKPIQPPSRKAQRLIKMVYSSQTTPNTQISRKVTFLEEPTETHYLVIFPVSWISKNQPEYSPVHTLPLLPHLVGTPQEGNSMVSHLRHSDIPLFWFPTCWPGESHWGKKLFQGLRKEAVWGEKRLAGRVLVWPKPHQTAWITQHL